MASTLFIAEYSGFLAGSNQVGNEPSLDQTLAVGVTSAPSVAFSPNTKVVRLVTDASCSIAFGYSPTATLTNKLLPANVPEYFSVRPGFKVACIANS